ncbi:MAG: TonB-dependent receptor, partial [Bacteroides sp.]
YNVDHLFGFFSVFTPEAVKKVTLFKSSFPARFGGRLSSVVDVRSNDGDMKRFHGTFSLGLLSAKVQLEGPIIKDRTSFNISARRSYVDLLAKPFMPKDEKMSYFFYDINAKVNHKFSDRSRLYLNFYNGKDHYHFTSKELESQYSYGNQYKDKMSIDWGNTVVSTRWNYIFNNKLFSNTTIAYNNYLMSARSEAYSKTYYGGSEQEKVSNYEANFRSGINDWNYAIDFDYTPLPTHRIRFGGNYLFHRFRPEVMTSKIYEQASGSVQQDTAFHSLFNKYIYAHEASVYAEDDFELTPRLQINAGVHISLFNVQKKTYFSVQPRLSARYQLPKHFALKASYSKMSQYIHLLSSTPISMPTDLWVPVTSKIKPMQAHQYSIGAYYNGLPGWEFSIESYYKQMRNVLEYKEGVSFLGSSTNWEDKVEMGKGRSMGIEFMAQKLTGKTTGWIAYTLARSDRQFAKGGINNGERFPYKYDRRHN